MEQPDLIAIVVGVAALVITPYVVRIINRCLAWVDAHISSKEIEQLRYIAREVVLYCKQKGLTGEIAFQEAKRQIERIASERGLNINVDRWVEVLIEAGVFDELKRPFFVMSEAAEGDLLKTGELR